MRTSAHVTITTLFTGLFLAALGTIAFSGTEEVFYEQKCGRCHEAFLPSEYSADEWPGLVRSMRAQAALTSAEITRLTEYLSGAAGEGGSSGGQGPVVGGYLYSEYFETPQAKKNFDIHYLAVHLSGWASENIAYYGEFELEHGGKGDNTFVEQAYIDYWVLPNVALKIGAILTPFNRFDDFHGPMENFTVTRPTMAREIGVSAWKDVGVDVHGYFNVHEQASVGFDAYTINGLGDGSNLRGSRQYRDNNENKAFGGRLHVVLRDMLEVGGSVYHGAWDDGGMLDLNLYGGHVLLTTPVADFYGEYAAGDSENSGGVEDGDISGYFVQASRLFESKYRPTVRYGMLDYLDLGSELGRDPSKGDVDAGELVFAFAYYPVPSVAFKIEYMIATEGDRADDVDNNQLGLQAAIRF